MTTYFLAFDHDFVFEAAADVAAAEEAAAAAMVLGAIASFSKVIVFFALIVTVTLFFAPFLAEKKEKVSCNVCKRALSKNSKNN